MEKDLENINHNSHWFGFKPQGMKKKQDKAAKEAKKAKQQTEKGSEKPDGDDRGQEEEQEEEPYEDDALVDGDHDADDADDADWWHETNQMWNHLVLISWAFVLPRHA